jgi:hypothetical protein
LTRDPAADPAPQTDLIQEHRPHRWEEVGICVWCVDCNVRLYQGNLPEWKDPGRPARQALCDHDWDPEAGLGFYFICTKCGFKEWAE